MNLLASDAASPPGTLAITNTDDVIAQAERIRGHAAVALEFPRWTDGRAYSQAVLLRARVRFTGDIVATGDVVVDMLPLLRRCGFTGAKLRADQRPETAARVLGQIDLHYQASLAERCAVVQ